MYEALTMPSAVPALGRDVSTDYRTHPVDLSAQKLILSAPKPSRARECTAIIHPTHALAPNIDYRRRRRCFAM